MRTVCTTLAYTHALAALLLFLPHFVQLRQTKERSRLSQSSIDDQWVVEQLERLIKDSIREGRSYECDRKSIEASEWITNVDRKLQALEHNLTTAGWKYQTNLTNFNAEQYEEALAKYENWITTMLPSAREHLANTHERCNATTVRLLQRFLYSSTVPIANSPETRKKVNSLITSLEEIYGTTTVTDKDGKEYRLEPELTELFTNSRDYHQLQWAWEAWHNATGPRMKSLYAELVDGMNEGARDNGFADVGIAWQVSDFEEANIERLMDELFLKIKPFYQQLHAYVRRRLIVAYPNHGIDPRGPIPAHLFGDMWAQQWGNIIDLLLPYPDTVNVDVTAALLEAEYTPIDMFRTAEEFYTSIGLNAMTADFWSKSVLVRPSNDVPMICHGSADDFYTSTDFRIKMCTVVSQVDFDIVHHEMGHIEYFMEYRHQPTLFRTGANAAFHEAIGDTIGLSVVTKKHLETIKLIPSSQSTVSSQDSYKQDINFLMKMALNKVAFLPFAYIMDKWRYRVFRGDVLPEHYNIDWWKLRRRYQGMTAPSKRPIEFFDPGSKYHIPANVPYSRYFLSFIGQFQFQSTLCQLAGHRGSLHTCDIYRSTEAGHRLKSALKLGASRPWPEVMEVLTGQREFSIDAIMEYFGPLYDWLKKQNKNHLVGW